MNHNSSNRFDCCIRANHLPAEPLERGHRDPRLAGGSTPSGYGAASIFTTLAECAIMLRFALTGRCIE